MQIKMPGRDTKIDIARAFISTSVANTVLHIARAHGHAMSEDRATPFAAVTAGLCGAAASALFTLIMYPESGAGD
jgi:hypothetical protein